HDQRPRRLNSQENISSPLRGRIKVGVKIRMAHSAKRIAKKLLLRRSALCSLRSAIKSPSP
ncbi:MAG: hypothetical protein PVH81_03410, partial [Syntrophobacterales bacterium]